MIGRECFASFLRDGVIDDRFVRYGISPGGLASQSYSGVMFFDMDW